MTGVIFTLVVSAHRDVGDVKRCYRAVIEACSVHTVHRSDCCVAFLDIAGHQRLRAAHRRQLDVLCYQLTTLGHRPTIWNSLPDELRDETENTFRQSVKTLLFRQY